MYTVVVTYTNGDVSRHRFNYKSVADKFAKIRGKLSFVEEVFID